MTFFEKELRKIVGGICPTATYVGRACYVELNETNRAKIEFIDPRVVDEYDALQVKILNRNEGQVDSLRLRFKDILGVKSVANPNFRNGISPYAWSCNGETSWYVYQPNQADYIKLQKNLLDYLKVFDYQKQRKASLDAKITEATPGAKQASGKNKRAGLTGPDDR